MNIHISTVIVELIKDIYLKKELNMNFDDIEKCSLRNDLGFDSFDLAELCVRIEDEFNVDVFEVNSALDYCHEIYGILIVNEQSKEGNAENDFLG